MLRELPQRMQIGRFFKDFREAEWKCPQRQLRYNRYVHHGNTSWDQNWIGVNPILRHRLTHDGQAKAVPDSFRFKVMLVDYTLMRIDLNRKQSLTASTLHRRRESVCVRVVWSNVNIRS